MKTAGAVAATITSSARHPAMEPANARAREPARLAAAGGHGTLALVLLGWQTALALALAHGIVGLAEFSAIHVAGCLALAVFVHRRWPAAADRDCHSKALQIVAWSALAGPFGAFVAAALVLPAARDLSEVAEAAGEIQAVASPERERVDRIHRALLDRRIRIDGAARVRPLMDVITEGSRSEKLDALAVLYRRYDARLAPVLKRAMRDSDTSVRVLAATVTAKLNATYGRTIGDRQSAAAAASNIPQVWRDLADARIVYAASGLLEEQRARREIELAIDDLSRSTELDPVDRASNELLDRAHRQLAAWPTKQLNATEST